MLAPALLFYSHALIGSDVHESAPQSEDLPIDSQTEIAVNEVIVHGRAFGKNKIEFDELESVSLIDLEMLSRRQSNDVFEALDSVAGLSIEGGLRTRGKSFSIRGFSDNEDVLLIVDGVPQNFEKYRAGSSVEIETELLKEIAVFRGGSATNLSASYIGGAIQIETKDASDFLLDGKNYGANIKSGWHSNNEAQRYLLNLYGKPTESTDVIFSGAFRDTNNFHLPNDEQVLNSKEKKVSSLAKFEYASDELEVGFSYRESDGSGREPFDTQSGSDAIFGVVRRQSDEQASTLRLNWNPASSVINTKATIGTIDKTVTDTGGLLTGGCPKVNDETDYKSPACGVDTFVFDIFSSNISNSFIASNGWIDLAIDIGAQYIVEERAAQREYRETNGTAGITDDFRLPPINNPNQPPATKTTTAYYIDTEARWHNWKLGAGMRVDTINIAPDDPETERLLKLRGSGSSITLHDVTPNLSLSWSSRLASIFYRYRENFRPPLADELYGRSLLDDDGNVLIANAFGRCDSFAMFYVPPGNPPDLFDDFGGDVTNWEIATDEYNAYVMEFNASNAATNESFLVQNAFCADVYKTEESVTHESGLSLELGELLGIDLYKAALKLTYFDIRTKRLVESIEEVNGIIVQPGEEFRFGYEVELTLDADSWFGEFNYSDLRGYELGRDDNGLTLSRYPLNNPPATSFNFTAGWRLLDSEIQFGLKSRIASSRRANNQSIISLARNRSNLTRIDGYHVESLFLQWYPSERFNLNFAIDNLFNETYRLRGFQGAQGEIAPGRDYRLNVSLSF